MDRRSFLSGLLKGSAALAAASVVDKEALLYALERQGVADPERELWMPGEKSIFIPGSDIIQVDGAEKYIRSRMIIDPSDVRVELSNGVTEFYGSLRPGAPLLRRESRSAAEMGNIMNMYRKFGRQ